MVSAVDVLGASPLDGVTHVAQLSCIEPVLIVGAWHSLKDIHNKKKKRA